MYAVVNTQAGSEGVLKYYYRCVLKGVKTLVGFKLVETISLATVLITASNCSTDHQKLDGIYILEYNKIIIKAHQMPQREYDHTVAAVTAAVISRHRYKDNAV